MIAWHIILWLLLTHLIPDTWYLIPVLDTWYLTLDIWHLYLTCYHLTPDTWHLIYDTWQLTCYHLILIYAITWYWHIWPDIMTPDWILLHLTPVLHCIFMIITVTRTLTWLLYYYQTSGTPVLLNPYTPELLYLMYSCPLHCFSC